MKEHGLLLSTPMAMARHAGRKTQTRRLITLHNSNVGGGGSRILWKGYTWSDFGLGDAYVDGPSLFSRTEGLLYLKVPLMRDGEEMQSERVHPVILPGDRIWWKETHRLSLQGKKEEPGFQRMLAYRADGDTLRQDHEVPVDPAHNAAWDAAEERRQKPWNWCGGRFMQRWMARHVDTVTAVRPERLSAVTDEDAIAEGVAQRGHADFIVHGLEAETWDTSARGCYLRLIQHLHGDGILKEDPWVWVYEWKL
jgi:hypothetical protein